MEDYGSTEYKTFIKFDGHCRTANFTFSYRFVIKIGPSPSIRLPKVFLKVVNMEGQRFSKIMQTTRILALVRRYFMRTGTGSLGFKAYTHLSEVARSMQIYDRHLHKLSLDL